MMQYIPWNKLTLTGRLFSAEKEEAHSITLLFLAKCLIFMSLDIGFYFVGTIASYRFLAWTLFTPAERGFYCNDPNIREKYYNNTVPTLYLLGITLALPFFIIFIADFLSKIKKQSRELAQVLNHSTYVYLDYTIAFWLATLALDVLKCFVGRTRPNFISMCQPKELQEICAIEPDAFVPVAHCTTQSWKSSRNSKLSFPSGHATASVFATLFLFFYLRGVQRRSPSLSLRLFSFAVCAFFAIFTGIRKWRRHTDDQIQAKTVRTCPECRVHSDYVIPSKSWIDDKAQKEKLINLFRENTKKIQCKYVKGGNMDKCPFGNKCFYKHQMPDGTIVEGKSPTAMRNERRRRFTFQDFLGLTDSSSDADEMSFGEFLRRGLDLDLVDSDENDVADW